MTSATLDAPGMHLAVVNSMRYQAGIGCPLAGKCFMLPKDALQTIMGLKISDCLQSALSSGIPRFPAKLAATEYIENAQLETFGHIDPSLTAFINGLFIDTENEIYSIIGRPTINLWCLEVSGGLFTLRNYGDFRVIQWSEEHLDADGNYYR